MQAEICVFPTALGWMALVGCAGKAAHLVFGHDCEEAALAGLPAALARQAIRRDWNPHLAARLRAYAEGARDQFLDVPVTLGPIGQFRARVYRQCRCIPYGNVLTYGQLAAQVGSPRAARAVGNALAANRLPILIACHRVVAAGGGLGGFSAPGGLEMKTRLLTLEGYLPQPKQRSAS